MARSFHSKLSFLSGLLLLCSFLAVAQGPPGGGPPGQAAPKVVVSPNTIVFHKVGSQASPPRTVSIRRVGPSGPPGPPLTLHGGGQHQFWRGLVHGSAARRFDPRLPDSDSQSVEQFGTGHLRGKN